jgi:hypothetical protein
MTADQLTLADCDPAWADLTPKPATRRPRVRPSRPATRDLRHQDISRRRLNRIVDVPVVGEWL